ncbi:EamA domain-containing membrane protein RarD [Pseudacidovorax intermedius]|uniref:EamA domain-containing membrane protein RarD n=2 Tax=Pseudacidovorax intermedius TaxID=433924 RepID=A0A370FD66_9BURK|nr:EamA domain-containing membrane protein RarD [Pseudacidovorax intermedius]
MSASAPAAKPDPARSARRGLTHSRAVGLMVLVTLMWATAGVVTRQLERAASFEVTFWRSFFTLLAMVLILGAWRGRGLWRSLREGGRHLWISGACWSVMFTAFMVALTLTTTANVLVTLATGPLLAALAARLFIGHRLPARTWAAIAVAGAGIAWMYGAQIGDDGALAGTLVALCVPIAGACHWTNVQQAHASGADVDLLPAVLIGAAVSAACTLPLAWPFTASGRDLALLGFLGVFQLAIPCMLSMMAAGVLKAPEVALLALLEVLFGIALAWVGAGEAPAPTVFSGGLLVIGALVANEWLGWRAARGQR